MNLSQGETMPVRMLFLTALLLAVGCGETNSVNNKMPESATEELTAAGSDAVSLEVLTSDETDELIASHKGKIVVVDLWALW